MSNQHFAVEGDSISPQPWMQQRHLAFGEAEGVTKQFAPSGGGSKNLVVHTVDVKWTNDTPVAQWVYGMVTRAGAQVALQARSQAYLSTWHGVTIRNDATLPAGFAFEMEEVSYYGGGMTVGKGGVLTSGTGFGVHRHYKNSQSAPLMPHMPGLYRLEPGQTFFARVTVKFISYFWENTRIDGGESGTESSFTSGDTRVDLYGVPSYSYPPARPIPQIVGVRTATALYAAPHVGVSVPAGTQAGDVLVAIVANNFSLAGGIVPKEAGWTQLHNRNDGAIGPGVVHMRVFARIATAAEPAQYRFDQAWLIGAQSDATVHLIALRDAHGAFNEGWQVASAMYRDYWRRSAGHVAPSIDRPGQLLLCASYMAHPGSPKTQTPPPEMTEISDSSGTYSMMSVAAMASPPRPTGTRMFMPTRRPVGPLSIAVSILVPGKLPAWNV